MCSKLRSMLSCNNAAFWHNTQPRVQTCQNSKPQSPQKPDYCTVHVASSKLPTSNLDARVQGHQFHAPNCVVLIHNPNDTQFVQADRP